MGKISRTARYYIYQKKLSEYTPVRFDVVSIEGDSIRLIRNAFDFCE